MKQWCFVLLAIVAILTQAADTMVQSARSIPLVRDADVVVVGGSCAAVAAAIAAREQGAEVFLVAPRTSLGDDVAGTRELWPDLTSEYFDLSLAQRVFTLQVPYSYISSATPDKTHPDAHNTCLKDGVKFNAVNGSVQYNGNTSITIIFNGTGGVDALDLYYYKRTSGATPFDTVVSGLEKSSDGIYWESVAVDITVEQQTFDAVDVTMLARLTPQAPLQTAWLRLQCDVADGLTRQLLDELIVRTTPSAPMPGSSCSTTPLQIKRKLDTALAEAGVTVLTGTLVSDVIWDGNGEFAGVVMANRSGRQAVTARVMIDATESALPACCAGATKRAFMPDNYQFSRIVIADATNAPQAVGMGVIELPDREFSTAVAGVSAPVGMAAQIQARVYRCTFSAYLADGSMSRLLEVEQVARDKSWCWSCVDAADRLSWLPPDRTIGMEEELGTAWQSAAAINLNAFRPQGAPFVYVVGILGDITDPLANALRNPLRSMALGRRIGIAAAAEAANRVPTGGISLPADPGAVAGNLEVHEILAGLPPAATNACGGVLEGARDLPILAECEVLVVGAGTSGAPAAIAAGRAGTDTILMDVLYTMGGVQTDGRIGVYYHGNDCGFSKNEVDPGWQAIGAVLYAAKAEWYRQSCRSAGVRILYGTIANGMIMDDTLVKGVVVLLPDGTRGVISAKVVIDATGNADLAAAAGAETEFIKPPELAVQGAGWARHLLGNSYMNSDIGFINDAAVTDVSWWGRRVRASMPVGTWDAGHNPATRERRRLVGVVTVTPIDILNARTWPDTIVQPISDFDSHGFSVHDLFIARDPGRNNIQADLPFRALLPKNIDGMLVTGLAISAQRDAMPLLRMQRDVQNQGYAAGYAAALAVQSSVAVRNVNIATLQQHLLAKGIIKAQCVGQVDNFPLSAATIESAVYDLSGNYATLHTVLADMSIALPALRDAYANAAEAAARLTYAHILGLAGDASGAQTLAEYIGANSWDTGWNFKGMGQYGRSMSTMDSYIVALGRTEAPLGVVPLIDKVMLMDSASSFSHYRAVTLAGESLDGGSIVNQLSRLLAEMECYALSMADELPLITGYSDTLADKERNSCLVELYTARALYRLGDDSTNSGEQRLLAYAYDPREIFAAFARQALADGVLNGTSDGEWISTAATANWSDGANWADATVARGHDARATITNVVNTSQTISLQGALLNIGVLDVAGAVRILSNGVIDIGGEQPAIEVADGSSLVIQADVIGLQPLVKRGEGLLAFGGQTNLDGMEVQEGEVAFVDPDLGTYQAYSADTNSANTQSLSVARSLRVDFCVNQKITVTHLGVYDSNGDGFEYYKKAALFKRSGGNPLAALAFIPGESNQLHEGYRFRKLPEPLHLQPDEYALVVYGFYGNDRYIAVEGAGTGEQAGALDDGNGAITFYVGAYSADNNALAFPATRFAIQSAYGVAAGSLRFNYATQPKSFNGNVELAQSSKLLLQAQDVRLNGGLTIATGNSYAAISNCLPSGATSLTIGVPANVTNTLDTAQVYSGGNAELTLVKSGAGELELTGTPTWQGGLHIKEGTTRIGAWEELAGIELSFDTGGKLLAASGGVLDSLLYVANQTIANSTTTRLITPSGTTTTITRGIDSARAATFTGFAIQPRSELNCFPDGNDNGIGATRVKMLGARLGYVDLYLLGDFLPGSGHALHDWQGVRGGLRKLACGHETVDGCSVVFGNNCDFTTDWFDIAASNAVVSITSNASVTVANEVRFVDGNDSQLTLNGGKLRMGVMGVENTSNHHLSKKPLLFNGTVIEALKNSDYFMNLSMASAAPQICDGSAFFDTCGYDVAIRGKGFVEAPGSKGALVKLGAGTLKIATPMEYLCDTLVSNGTLRLDFALCAPSNQLANLLNPLSVVRVSSEGSLEIRGTTNAAGAVQHQQSLHKVVGGTAAQPATLRINQAELALHAMEGAWEKSGAGTLTLAAKEYDNLPFGGHLTLTEGVFAIRCFRQNFKGAVPCPSFESTPLLPPSPINSMDKRGTAATDCAGWTFNSNDAGYQRNNSYFSSGTTLTTKGVQTAFVRRSAYMQANVTLPATANYTISFDYAPRYYNSVWHDQHLLKISFNGVAYGAVMVTNRVFMRHTVDLGPQSAGTYPLRFTGSTELSPGGDPCTLVDDIQIEGITAMGSVTDLSGDTSALNIMAGTQVELDYIGIFEVGELTINGTRYVGGRYSADTHPETFSGPGTLKSKSPGTLMILR